MTNCGEGFLLEANDDGSSIVELLQHINNDKFPFLDSHKKVK